MNYITIINAFWDSATTNPLSTGQVSLYFALLHVCNRSDWTEWFQAPNQVLTVLTGLSRSGILRARNELKQRGLVDFRERGTKATVYKIIMPNSTQDGAQDCTRNSTRTGTQDCTRKRGTLKDIDKDREKKRDNPPKSPVEPVALFEEFMAAYPKRRLNRAAAEHAYCRALRDDCSLTEENLLAAVRNYAEAVRILGRQQDYIRSPESFLSGNFFVSYLPGQYVKPESGSRSEKNRFTQFEQNDYDFGQLEAELLEN